MNWFERVNGSAKIVFMLQEALAAMGPGIEELLWDHGVSFLELSPGVPFVAIPDEYFPEEIEKKGHVQMDQMGYGMVEGFYNHKRRMIVLRNPQRYVLIHEIGHALDHALNWYGSDVLTGKDDPARFDHIRGGWRQRKPREPFSQYAMTHPRERFAEAFAGYLDAEPGTFGRYAIDRLRATDRTAAALMRRIFREANGSIFEMDCRPVA